MAQSSPPSDRSLHAGSLDRGTALGFFVVGLALYGPSLSLGYLADDFLYLSWLDQGFAELVRRLTVDSNPQMLRPLTAPGWALSTLPGGAILQHALSLALHVAAALGVVALAQRLAPPSSSTQGAAPDLEARLCGLLFLTCPLLTEPVLWLSAAPDLWATALALAALVVGLGGGSTLSLQRALGSALLFSVALLAKESVVVLPLVALALLVLRRLVSHRQSAEHSKIFGQGELRWVGLLGGVAVAYLLARFALFGGLGGYLDAEGRSVAHQFDPKTYLRNLTLQLPLRLAMPLKRAGLWTLPVVLASVAAGVAVVGPLIKNRKRWKTAGLLGLAVIALAVATLPVAPVLSVDVDHGGGRLVYFPLAIALAALGGILLGNRPPTAANRPPVGLLVLLLLWVPLLVANTQSWRQAGREVRHTLDALERSVDRFPDNATVWVDGNDSWHGAYVWRNGFDFALRRSGLTPRQPWRLGTLALAPEAVVATNDASPDAPSPLGHSVFEIAIDREGQVVDRSSCYAALQAAAPEPVQTLSVPPSSPAQATRHTLQVTLESPQLGVALALHGTGPVNGFVAWRHRGVPRFNTTQWRPFRVVAGLPTWLPLPPPSAALDQLELQIDLGASPQGGTLTRVAIYRLPEACF